MTRMRSICAASILALAASGCATPPPPSAPQQVTGIDRLRPGDTVTITVFGQEELTGDQVIDAHGEVSVLLAGRTKIAGMTPAEAESKADHLAGAMASSSIPASRSSSASICRSMSSAK
ncbi:MAG: polysaccharide biosynthesis/export family protein [Aliidongia sp.]